MAKGNSSRGSTAAGAAKAKRPKRDWTKDRFLYVVAIELPASGDPIDAVKQAVADAGGTFSIRNRVFKRGKEGADETGKNGGAPSVDEIEQAAR